MYKIFTLSLARVLIKRGYRVEKVEPNRNKPWLNVYCFIDSPELREEVINITSKNNNV